VSGAVGARAGRPGARPTNPDKHLTLGQDAFKASEGEAASYWVTSIASDGRLRLGVLVAELADQMAGRDRLACLEVKLGLGLGATLFNTTRQGEL